jgi:hypothetical protein
MCTPGLEQVLTVTTTLVAKVYTRMMKIIRFYKEKLRWDLEKLYALQKKGQDTLKENLSAVICDSGNVEIQ